MNESQGGGIAPKAIARFKERIREQTRRTRSISLPQNGQGDYDLPARLARILRRLSNAFGAAPP